MMMQLTKFFAIHDEIRWCSPCPYDLVIRFIFAHDNIFGYNITNFREFLSNFYLKLFCDVFLFFDGHSNFFGFSLLFIKICLSFRFFHCFRNIFANVILLLFQLVQFIIC